MFFFLKILLKTLLKVLQKFRVGICRSKIEHKKSLDESWFFFTNTIAEYLKKKKK